MEQTQKPKNFILGILSKTKYIIITAVVLFALIMFFMDSLIGNVDANEYQVKQAFMTGELSAHLTPGWFLKAMGTIYRFPKTETVYFTRDNITHNNNNNKHISKSLFLFKKIFIIPPKKIVASI